MSRLSAGISAFVITLMMYGLSRTTIYLDIVGNGLVVVLLLFTMTTIGVLIGMGMNTFSEPKIPKSSKKERKGEIFDTIKTK